VTNGKKIFLFSTNIIFCFYIAVIQRIEKYAIIYISKYQGIIILCKQIVTFIEKRNQCLVKKQSFCNFGKYLNTVYVISHKKIVFLKSS